jgi:hypothetical protein
VVQRESIGRQIMLSFQTGVSEFKLQMISGEAAWQDDSIVFDTLEKCRAEYRRVENNNSYFNGNTVFRIIEIKKIVTVREKVA